MGQAVATAIAEALGVTRDFHGGGGIVRALRGIDLRIQPGEFVALRWAYSLLSVSSLSG